MILGENSGTVDRYAVQDYLNNLGVYKSMESNDINLRWTMSLQGHLLSYLKSSSPCRPRKVNLMPILKVGKKGNLGNSRWSASLPAKIKSKSSWKPFTGT